MMNWIWLGAVVAFGVLEAATAVLVSIWFVGGAAVALLASFLGAALWLQIALFLAVSVLLLIFTRPICRRIFSFGIKDTNNQEIGRIAVVIQEVDPVKNTGRVRLDGVDWIAVSQDGTIIPENTSVRIEAVSGTKLTVSRLPETVTAGTAQ